MTTYSHTMVATSAPGATTNDEQRCRRDIPTLAVAVSRRLLAAGLPITPERAVSFADALALVGAESPNRLYWTARAVFVSDPVQVAAFDQVFASVFGDGDGDARRG